MTNSLHSLNRIQSFQDAKRTWADGKLSGQSGLTNFFLSQQAIERATTAGKLWGLSLPGASLLLRGDRDFFHTYANFSDTTKMKSLLEIVPDDIVLVADVLQRNGSHKLLINTFEEAGFTPYRELNRIHRSPQSMSESARKVEVRYAKPPEAEHILTTLESKFDRFSEQLPGIDEIVEAICNDQILISPSEGNHAGFLYFESSGQSSILRYWYVDPDFRDHHVGSTLIRHYLINSCPNESSQLWVGSENSNAILRYHHYGYAALDLRDQILIRR